MLLADVNWTNPIVRSHHLALGQQGLWLCTGVSGRSGGITMRDLWGRNNGTLAVIDANNGWRSTDRPCGVRHLAYNGSTGRVSCGVPNNIKVATKLTVSGWIRPGVLTRGDWITHFGNSTGTNRHFDLLGGLTSGKFQFFIGTASTTPNSGNSTTTFVVGGWYHVTGTFDGTTISIYVNGNLENSAASGAATITGSTSIVSFGCNDSGGGANFATGAMDCVAIWDRCLSAGDVRAWHKMTKNGFRGFLRRMDMDGASEQAAAAGTILPHMMHLAG